MFSKLIVAIALAGTALVTPNVVAAHADKAHVDVTDLWIRPTVEGQLGTGGFMKITAREDLQLIGISTAITKSAQVHEMRTSKTNADVKEMRQVASIALPKDQLVEFKPGGYHLMFLDLKRVLAKGETLPLTLHFKDASGKSSKLDVIAAIGRK